MNLFALTDVPGQRIVRFPLTNELQQEIAQVFREQLAAFTRGIVQTIDFDGRYTPEEGELLQVRDFVDVDRLQQAIDAPLAINSFDPAHHSLVRVKAFFTGENGKVLVQFFESRRLIANGNALAIFFSGNSFRRIADAGLTLDTKLLAVLEGNLLTFQSFHFLRRVFEMSEYFHEATSDEMVKFAAHDKLSFQDVDDFSASTSTLARKKVALILQSGVLDKFTLEELLAAAASLQVRVDTDEAGKIIVPSNKTDLRRLLRFLEEDYYESALSRTRYLSNSKRVAD